MRNFSKTRESPDDMSQSQVWKKRSTGLISEIRNQARSWLASDNKRRVTVVATGNRLKAGLKRRRF
jgi:hypothetical protein